MWLGTVFLMMLAPVAADGQAGPLSVTVGPPSTAWRPVIHLNGVLQDRALRDALASGLPLRFHLRIELWEKGFFDRLVAAEETSLALLQDPLEGTLRLSRGNHNRTLAGIGEVERAITRSIAASPQPARAGARYYYLATLEIETLSLSDLEELQRWLRGEARPAVQGRRPVGRALGRGLQRAVVRAVGLPTRRYAARSPTFTIG